MKAKILHSVGTSETFNVHETEYDLPMHELKNGGILVKTLYASLQPFEINQFMQLEPKTPIGWYKSEMIGIVIDSGSSKFFSKDDIIATVAAPAYADYFIVNENQAHIIPEAKPKYFIFSLINTYASMLYAIDLLKSLNLDYMPNEPKNPIAICGSDYKALLFGQSLSRHYYNLMYFGDLNKEHWNKLGIYQIKDIKEFQKQSYVSIFQTQLIKDDGKSLFFGMFMDPISEQLMPNGIYVGCVDDTESLFLDVNRHAKKRHTLIFRQMIDNKYHIYDDLIYDIYQGNISLDWIWKYKYSRNDYNIAFTETITRPKTKTDEFSYFEY